MVSLPSKTETTIALTTLIHGEYFNFNNTNPQASGKTTHNLCSPNDKNKNIIAPTHHDQNGKLSNTDNYKNGKPNHSFKPYTHTNAVIYDYDLPIPSNPKGSINQSITKTNISHGTPPKVEYYAAIKSKKDFPKHGEHTKPLIAIFSRGDDHHCTQIEKHDQKHKAQRCSEQLIIQPLIQSTEDCESTCRITECGNHQAAFESTNQTRPACRKTAQIKAISHKGQPIKEFSNSTNSIRHRLTKSTDHRLVQQLGREAARKGVFKGIGITILGNDEPLWIIIRPNHNITSKGINDSCEPYYMTILGRRRLYSCVLIPTKRARGHNWPISSDLVRCREKKASESMLTYHGQSDSQI